MGTEAVHTKQRRAIHVGREGTRRSVATPMSRRRHKVDGRSLRVLHTVLSGLYACALGGQRWIVCARVVSGCSRQRMDYGPVRSGRLESAGDRRKTDHASRSCTAHSSDLYRVTRDVGRAAKPGIRVTPDVGRAEKPISYGRYIYKT